MVFRKIARRFEKPYAMEAGRLEAWGEFVPKGDYEIFGRGNDAPQKGDFLIQISMVAGVHDGREQDPLQFAQVDQVAGLGIGSAADGNFQDVIVPVPVGVGTQSIAADVPSVALARIVKPMRRVKMYLARHGDDARQDPGRRGISTRGF